MPVPKDDADRAFNVATCIGCGACVAACPNGSASLFMGAKVTHLGLLPQGQPERDERVVNMVAQHDHEGFGGCTNIGACTAACPKEIPLDVISQLNKDLRTAIRTATELLPWLPLLERCVGHLFGARDLHHAPLHGRAPFERCVRHVSSLGNVCHTPRRRRTRSFNGR